MGFIAATAALIALPLLTVLGSPILWGLLPFFAIALGGVWWGLRRNMADGSLVEVLKLWPDRMTLVRRAPDGAQLGWEANPFWVRLRMHETGGPVENYVTLSGGGREVEIGAFLSPEERVTLYRELDKTLRATGVSPAE